MESWHFCGCWISIPIEMMAPTYRTGWPTAGAKLAQRAKETPLWDPPADDADQASAATDSTDAEIERLAKLTAPEYEHARKPAAEKLGFRSSILDRLVQAEREKLGLDGGDEGKQGHAIEFPEPEPWPDPVDGAALLDGLAGAIRRHVVMSDAARDAAALWVVHTFLIDCFLVSPWLGVTSPVKGCGKTTLLDVLGRLVPRALPTANVTPAALFRVVEGYRPTLLVDEADSFLHDNDELRGVLNSGHRKGGTVLRTVGDDCEPRAFNTFCPTVIALIGHLPDTLHDRAVAIDLKRRLRTESVEPYRPDRAGHLDVLTRKAMRWTQDHGERIAAADPQMPDGVINREADNWRPLLAIAAEAQGDWPKRARNAAEAARIAAASDEGSRLELLLGDIRDVFGKQAEMPSADLVEALHRASLRQRPGERRRHPDGRSGRLAAGAAGGRGSARVRRGRVRADNDRGVPNLDQRNRQPKEPDMTIQARDSLRETTSFKLADQKIDNVLRQLNNMRVCPCCMARALAYNAATVAGHTMGSTEAIEMFEDIISGLHDLDISAPDRSPSTESH